MARAAAPARLTARDLRWVAATAALVVRQPSLWFTAVRQVLVLAVPGWWRRAPFLPLPDRAYLRFRVQTAYGDPDGAPVPADVVSYLRWCRAWPEASRQR